MRRIDSKAVSPQLESIESSGISLGDLDGDGDLDAFLGSLQGPNGMGSNKVWLNNGNGICTNSACCANDISISFNSSPISSAIYQAGNTITSDGVVAADSTVTFQAGQAVILEPGFTAEAGSAFIAQIQSCTPAPMANSKSTETDEEELPNLLREHRTILPNINLIIAPNPFRNEAIIEYNLPDERPNQLLLFDILGRVLVLQPLSTRSAGVQQYRLNSSELSSGIYFVQLQFGREVITRKVRVLKH